jgi:hypothetical protein
MQRTGRCSTAALRATWSTRPPRPQAVAHASLRQRRCLSSQRRRARRRRRRAYAPGATRRAGGALPLVVHGGRARAARYSTGSPTTIHGGCPGLRSAAWVSTTGIYGQCCCAIWPARRSGAAIGTLALTYVEMALARADRLTATERAMASTVRGRPRPHPWRFQLSCSVSPMMMPSGPRRKQSR